MGSRSPLNSKNYNGSTKVVATLSLILSCSWQLVQFTNSSIHKNRRYLVILNKTFAKFIIEVQCTHKRSSDPSCDCHQSFCPLSIERLTIQITRHRIGRSPTCFLGWVISASTFLSSANTKVLVVLVVHLNKSTWIGDLAGTYLQLPLRQWGVGNVYLLVLSSWKVNIAKNPIAVMGL